MNAGTTGAVLVLLMPLLVGIALFGRGSLADGAGRYRLGRMIAGVALVAIMILVKFVVRWLRG